jgi:predicted house-cleaning noncanonical NTP pyrophosphatase (MazG superfamily)
MTLPKRGKLVRDLIPEIIKEAGGTPVTAQVEGADLREALRLKVLEEVNELVDADSEHLLEEIADVYEVLRSITTSLSREWSEIEELARQKRIERGAFDRGIWLIDTKPVE